MTAETWQGIAAEDVDQVTSGLSALLRRRARRLLTALLHPYRRQVAWTLVLIVAHRPSTVLLADRVALLADGVIVAEGTHAELLATEPRYAELMSGAEQDQESTMEVTAR